ALGVGCGGAPDDTQAEDNPGVSSSNLEAVAADATFKLCMANGNGYCIGSATRNPGEVVKTVHPSSARNITWHRVGIDGNGKNFGYLKFSNGKPMATNGSCEVVIKDSLSADGVIWVEIFTGGHVQYANRGCSGGANRYGSRLAGKCSQLNTAWHSKPTGTAGWCYALDFR